jgi:hypothetical protein
MTARPVRVKPAPSDIAGMFRAAADHTDYVRASTALSEIPNSMMTADDRATIVEAMIAATARLHKFRLEPVRAPRRLSAATQEGEK